MHVSTFFRAVADKVSYNTYLIKLHLLYTTGLDAVTYYILEAVIYSHQ
jgi:hypothetical protein